MRAETDYVMRVVEEREVRFVRLWFVDVVGSLKSLSVPVSELEPALVEGVGLDGSAIEARTRGRERDVYAWPDPGSFQILPWTKPRVARMCCDLRTPAGEPFAGDSRQALRGVLDQAADLGLTLQVGCEIEFFLFANDGDGNGPPAPLDNGSYFDLTVQDVVSDFDRRAIEHLEQMGIPVTASHHEVAPSQHEIHLKHTDPLSMADAITTFRIVVKEVARDLGLFATFMPKPLDGLSGSGMHLHLSLYEGEENLFFDTEGDSPGGRGRPFLAGLLAHAAETAAVSNQWVNSYKRIAAAIEAPTHVNWSRNGANALVRLPSGRPGQQDSARLELRSPDAAANPYLLFALVLGAGLRGIERGYELGAEAGAEGSGEAALPGDLGEATALFDASELARETLGDRLCDWFAANKRAEWDAYRATVTDFDRDRYLRWL
ncbi:MAG TPA: glutamine synthetase family protein [Solirubrobacterales bacterium]|nr:glutamine synthetase family protein [Solirubrobacterales bacterium]